MGKKNYLNFPFFRKSLYDGSLSERARLVYIHLLQKSSQKGCKENAQYNDIELTKELIAIDLGILTKKGEPAIKLIQRTFEELEEKNYIKRFQKYKTVGCPLTIRLNFSDSFLKKKVEENDETTSRFVHHYNPSLSHSNPSLSHSNPSLSHSNPSLSHSNESDEKILKEVRECKARIEERDKNKELEQAESSTVEDEDCSELPF